MLKNNKFIFRKFADNENPFSKSAILRRKRFEMFLDLFHVNSDSKILDVGGTEAIWLGTGLEKQVTLFNIAFKGEQINTFNYVIGNACEMNFSDKEFDIIFSNSVIEHVGTFEKQKQFAKEINRVGKLYWIQTPYKHFPIEPHFLFPFFQYFTPNIQRIIGTRWKYSHLMRNGEDILDELKRLRLMNKKEMKLLFPNAEIIEEKFRGLTKSLIAVKK